MESIIWSQSPDGLLNEFEVHPKDDYALGKVTISFVYSGHFEHFGELTKQGNADFDLRSRIAQHGIDFNLTSGFDINESKCIISLEGILHPWNTAFLPRDGHWWELIDPKRFFVGKLVDMDRRLLVTKDELAELVKVGKVRLPVGSTIGNDEDLIALGDTIYLPNEKLMTKSHIRDGLYDLPRDRLNEIRIPHKVDNLVIGPYDAVITHTNLRPHDLSFAIKLQQDNGIRHTRAFYIEPNSAHTQIIELMGNKTHPVGVSGVYGNFYRTEEKDIEPKIKVPGFRLSPEESKPKRHFRSSYVFAPSGSGLKRLMKVSPYDPISLRRFDNFIRGSQRGKSYYFHTFPPQEIILKLLSYAAENHIGSLVFNVPPIDEACFSTADYVHILTFSKYGVNVVWDSQQFGRLYFHRYAFMLPDKRRIFDKAYSSASIMAVFGSQFLLAYGNVAELTKVIMGWKEFTGGRDGYGTVVSGGGPGVMVQSLQAAKLYDLNTGSISIIKRSERLTIERRIHEAVEGTSQSYNIINVDFLFPFDQTEINKRQDTLIAIPKVYVVTEGGFGTFCELFEALMKKGFYFMDTPIFLLGDPEFFKPTLEQLALMGNRGRIAEHVKKPYTYNINHGDQFLPTLLRHYNFQNTRNA